MDPLIKSQLLYQLSYAPVPKREGALDSNLRWPCRGLPRGPGGPEAGAGAARSAGTQAPGGSGRSAPPAGCRSVKIRESLPRFTCFKDESLSTMRELHGGLGGGDVCAHIRTYGIGGRAGVGGWLGIGGREGPADG